MKRILSFGRLFLFSPSRAAEECLLPRSLAEGLKVYAVWVAASLLYLRFKPFDFPDVNAPIPQQARGMIFWAKVAAWGPVLAALNIALTGLALRWMRDGWLPLKTAAATLWCCLPLLLTVAYTRSTISKPLFAALFLAWTLPGAFFARRIPAEDWRRVAAFLLGLNAVGLVLLIPQAAASALRSDALYKASLALTVAWLLASGGTGLKRLADTSLPRAILAFLFANLALNVALAAAFLLGWLPMEVLKVLIYV